MDDLISIIVPVYNVEKYLKKCVDSIINQTYNNIEILLIDDGSTDNSGKLCDDYKKIDKRIKVYHKKNGGLSDARNYGINKANGKYVGFIDSDDFITKDMYEILYKSITKYDADVSIARVIDCYEIIPEIDNSDAKDCLLNKKEAIKKVMEAEEISVHVVSKLYKKSIFSKIKFEVGRTTEDGIIMIELLDSCKKISYNSSYVYYYIHRENSITTKKFNEKNGYDVIYAYEKNKKIIDEKYPELSSVAEMRLCWAYFRVLDSMVKSNTELDEKIVKYLRKKFVFIMKNKYFTKGRKISMLALKVSKKLYSIIVRKFYQKKRKNFS